jgi:Karyopherin (importin) alpha
MKKMDAPSLVSHHIKIRPEKIDLYERMMDNAGIPSPIIRHLRTMRMIHHQQTNNDNSLNEKNANISYKLFQEIASARHFDQYGRPTRGR